jgi:membrane-associated protease RseP (regulator of RpoE activity)
MIAIALAFVLSQDPQFAGEVEKAEDVGLTLDGLTVQAVAEKSPAAKSGIKSGDILKKVEGKDVASWDDVRAVCGERPFANELKIEVERAGKAQKLTLKISAMKMAVSNGRGGKAGKGRATLNSREYSYRVSPNAAKGAPAPLLILVHGDTWTSDEMIETVPQEAVNAGIVVAPNGIEKTWRDAGDAEFILALVAEMKKQYNVDLRSIYIAGHSSGGILALKLVQEHGNLFAGGAFFGVRSASSDKDSARKCPLLILHGSQDTIIPPADARKAADELKKKGWPATYQEEKGQAHAWVPEIAKKCWDWLKTHSLK